MTEAVSHATYVLAAAADASRGGAVVEQIPYVPGEVVDFDKIVLGSAACLGAYAWAAYEFGKVRHVYKFRYAYKSTRLEALVRQAA